MAIEKICERCGKSYSASTLKRRFCSRKCYANVVYQTCPQCGISFAPKRKPITFCSRSCYAKSTIGPGNQNWLPTKNLRPSNKRALRKRIKERDRFCQDCASNRSLQVHHIDGDPSNNDESNLILLCKPCHSDRHLKQGEINAAALILSNRVYAERVSKICPVCNKQFSPKLKRQVCCSKRCKGLRQGIELKGRKAWNNGINDQIVICETCGEQFSRSKGRLDARSGPKFCSKPCQIRYAVAQRVAKQRQKSSS